MLVLDEGVLAVADQHRADMLAGEVHVVEHTVNIGEENGGNAAY